MDDGAIRTETCQPVRELLARVGDKWTALILGKLGNRRLRFTELHRSVGDISQRMLVVTLRNLERDGLVDRIVYPTVPPRVEYEVTPRGHSLKAVLAPIGKWVQENQRDIQEARERFDLAAAAAASVTNS